MPTRSNNAGQTTSVEGYRAAIQMLVSESRQIGAVSSAMVVSNALIVALVGAIGKLYPQLTTMFVLLPWLGIGVCLAWFLVTLRRFAFRRYWSAQARHQKAAIVSPGSGGITDDERFANGESVQVGDKRLRLSIFAQLFRVEWLIYVVIGVFLLVYVGLIY